ncbi:MAG: hypothetical protein AAFX06_23120 [Planctomycetota bacterium]
MSQVESGSESLTGKSGSLIARTGRLIQLDRTLLFALASRVWQAASGPVTVALILRYLTPGQQGVYYTLVTIVGVQAFFELGLLNVLVSQAGHAHAGETESEDSSRQRMHLLIRSSFRWFAVASLLYGLTSLSYGWYTYSASDAPEGWRGPLCCLIPLAALTVFLSPILALLEGAGQRQFVYLLRLIQMVMGSLAVWSCLVVGLGIWTLVVSIAVQLACMLWAAARLRHLYPGGTDVVEGRDEFRWSRDVLPSQWRLAVASAAYHFATQLFPLIVLTFHTTIEAGRLGMTLTITTAIQMFSASWVQTKYSVAAQQHARGSREEAGTMWRQAAIISSVVLICGFGALALLIPATGWLRADLPTRFIEPWQVACLGIGAVAFHGVSLQSFYVLSRGGNPLLLASLIGSLAVGAGVWGLGYVYGTAGIALAYSCFAVAIALPVHTWAYLRYRKVGQ